MRHEVIAVLGLVLFSNLVRGDRVTLHSDTDVDKAIEWLKEFYNKSSGAPDNRASASNDGNNKAKDVKTCYTDNQEQGVCVKASLCKKEPAKIDPSVNFIWREKADCHFLEICCPGDQVQEPNVKKLPYVSPGCGYSNSGANVFRISDDNTKNGYADFGEFRWMIALIKTGTKGWANENYLGGGTLIHPSVVMTAAHKVMDLAANELKCRAGEWETQNENEYYIHQDRLVKNIIVHEEFNSLHAHNNIALLIMQEPFIIEPHIDVACLSPVSPPAGTACYSMGWGEDFTKSKKYAIILKKIPLPIVSANTCQTRYRNTRLGSGYTLHQSLTCAGGEAMVDTCLGDGGSSLVCPIGDVKDERYEVVGMVAYGLECGTANLPGVYVKVPHFYNWINRQMTLQGFDKSSYVY